MRLSNTLKVLKRRWYLVLLGLALTTAGCLIILDQIPANYEADGSLVLLPPTATVGDEGNPYLYLGGMEQALDVLAREVNAEEVTEPVLKGHPDTEYTIAPDRSTSGPILKVEAVGPTPGATMDVLYAALGTVPVSLDAMQNELQIEQHRRIGLMTVVVDAEPEKDDNQRVQLTIFAAALGVAGTVLITGLIDGLLLSRRRRDEEDRAAALTKPARSTVRGGATRASSGDHTGGHGTRPRRAEVVGSSAGAPQESQHTEADGDAVPRVGATRP